MLSEQEVLSLNLELQALMQYIQRVRQEIASINRGADGDDYFESMGEQLDAIVQATEAATNLIMEMVEKNQEAVNTLKETVTEPEQVALLDQIIDNGNAVFEACSFQDITGQRVSKIVKSVTYVEQRVNTLVEVWGRDALDSVEVVAEEKTADEAMLSGPQLKGQGISQDEIDKLFD
jgi:chemotaxis protein CheZ